MKNIKLIIDGYNFIHYPFQRHPEEQSDEGSPASGKKIDSMEQERETLVERLISYAGLTGNDVLLVFDGNSEQSIKKGGVEIMFTNMNSTADSFIEKILAKMNTLDNVILVTNDRETRDIATGLGVRVFTNQWLTGELSDSSDEIKEKYESISANRKIMVEDVIETGVRTRLDRFIGRPPRK